MYNSAIQPLKSGGDEISFTKMGRVQPEDGLNRRGRNMYLAQTFLYTLTHLYIKNIVVFLTAFSTRVSLLSFKIHNGMTLLKTNVMMYYSVVVGRSSSDVTSGAFQVEGPASFQSSIVYKL